MDPLIAAKLEEDQQFKGKVKKIADDYVQLGTTAVEYYVHDFDTAHDALMCYAALTPQEHKDIVNGHPAKFVLPMTATQVTTLTCFLSQILFGTNANRRVEPREDMDEEPAELMNQLLRWNDDQQPTYLTGYLFIQDALVFNRGVMYESWNTIYEVEVVPIEERDTTADPEGYEKDPETGEDVMDDDGERVPIYPTFQRWKKQRKSVGGFSKADIVSPYDFICDPGMPLHRMQEGRFAGHRLSIPWHELSRRSKLKKTDPLYVSPSAVEKLKKATPAKTPSVPSNSSGGDSLRSRSYYERQRRSGTQTQNGSASNKDDGGIVECWVLQIRATPEELEMYEDDQHEVVEILMGGQEVLSINVLPNKHDEFSYAVAEGRPYAHYQFSPSWAMMIQPIQRYCDYLKDKHQDALARTVGNIFIGRPEHVDFEAFTDPKKDGLFIPIKPDAPAGPLSDIVTQVSVTDLTKDFYNEMQGMISMAENTTGAHSFMQGEREEESDTATEFTAIQQMSSGRVSSVARLIWTQSVGPQTRRFVANFQQFLPDAVVIRVSGDNWQPQDEKLDKFVKVDRNSIQGHFDLVVHDGALPSTDARKVAAASRLIETISSNEILMQYFDPTVEGNVDLKKLFMHTIKATGIPIGNFTISAEQAQKNTIQKQQMSLPPGVRPAGAPPAGPNGQPVPPGPGGIPSASQLPATPPATPPPPTPV